MSNKATDKYYPAANIQKETLGEKSSIQSNEYISVLRGTLCSIPVDGAMADCFFAIYWNKLYPDPNPAIRKEVIDKRFNELAKDTEIQMKSKINEEDLAQSKLKFESLGQACFAFSGAESMFLEDIKQNKVVSQNVKTQMMEQFSVLIHLFKECIIFFSKEDHCIPLLNIYLETVSLYIAFLRDVHFFGKEWSLPVFIIDGTPVAIQETIKSTLEIVRKFRTSLCATKNNYHLLTKQLVFSDLKLYPLQQVNLPTMDDPTYLRIQNRELRGEPIGIRIPNDTTDKIYTLQWDTEELCDGLKQYITLPGIKTTSIQKYLLHINGSKNLQLRFSALSKPGIHYQIVARSCRKNETLFDLDFKYDNEKEFVYPSSLGDAKFFKVQKKLNINDDTIEVTLTDSSGNIADFKDDSNIPLKNRPKSGFISLEIIDTKN